MDVFFGSTRALWNYGAEAPGLATIAKGIAVHTSSISRVEKSRDETPMATVLRTGIHDDGPGFDLQTVRQRSSGLQLVQGLARQLRGQFEVTRNPNTRCSVLFSKAMA
jgi:two-component sensor histidine kinase